MHRFELAIVFLLVSLAMTGYGFFGNQTKLYQKPDARDDPENLQEDTAFYVSEIQLTDWVSKERVHLDEYGHLLDLEQEAECFS